MLERLKNSIREYPDFPKKGIIFKDISPIIADPELFNDLTEKLSCYPFFRKTDAIIAIDARGFIFGSAVATIIKKPLILARKKYKLPGVVIESSYGLEYGSDSLSIQESAILPFKKFVIVDDLLATGGTVNCVANLLNKKKKKVNGLLTVVELIQLNGRSKFKFPVESIISVKE